MIGQGKWKIRRFTAEGFYPWIADDPRCGDITHRDHRCRCAGFDEHSQAIAYVNKQAVSEYASGGIVPGGPRDDITPTSGNCDYVVPKGKGGLFQGPGNDSDHVILPWVLGEWVINRDGTGQQVVKIADGRAHFGPVTQLFDPVELREAVRQALEQLNQPDQENQP